MATSLNNLALLYVLQGKYAQAESLHQRALAIREQQLGSKHPSTAASLYNLAYLYTLQKKFTKAEELYQHVLVIFEQTLGTDHPHTLDAQRNYAQLQDLKARGRLTRFLSRFYKNKRAIKRITSDEQ